MSPAYSLISRDFAKLRSIVKLMTPGLVFAADGAAFAPAIEAVLARDVEIVVRRNPPRNRRTSLFSELAQTPAGPEVDAAHRANGPDTLAKILFTSGSTGTPIARAAP